MNETALDLDFFTYRLYYDYLINKFKDGDTFVEIGTWIGTSTVYAAEKIKKKNLKMNFYTIDTFKGSVEHQNYDIILANKLYDTYLKNSEHVKEYIQTLIGDSKELSKNFQDESIDYIFIDGDHEHSAVKKDIELWYPKVKFGGIFSGHDYIWGGQGVKPIIDQFSLFKVKEFGYGDVWFYEK